MVEIIKNSAYGVAKFFCNIFRFIGDLVTVNHGNVFENHYNEIKPPELILKKENDTNNRNLIQQLLQRLLIVFLSRSNNNFMVFIFGANNFKSSTKRQLCDVNFSAIPFSN